MAEFRNQPTGTTPTTYQAPSPAGTTLEATTMTANEAVPDKLSVAAGKLMEVDLGGTLSRHEEEAAAKAAKPVKVRLGRDGKPWRPRKRRNSDDLARDALIDSIMKENSRMYLAPLHPYFSILTWTPRSITIPGRCKTRSIDGGEGWECGGWCWRIHRRRPRTGEFQE
jgi:hypothetical protein